MIGGSKSTSTGYPRIYRLTGGFVCSTDAPWASLRRSRNSPPAHTPSHNC